MKKRLFAGLLTITMLVSLLPGPALAAEAQRPEWAVTAFEALDEETAFQTVPQGGGEPVLPDTLTAWAYQIEDNTEVTVLPEQTAPEGEQPPADGQEEQPAPTGDGGEDGPAPVEDSGDALTAAPVENDPAPADEQEPEMQQITISGVAWIAEPEYDHTAPGAYRFTPVLPAAYAVDEGVELPAVTVAVEAAEQPPAEAAEQPPVERVLASIQEHDITAGPLNIDTNGTYTVTGTTTQHNITVASGVEATIILSGVSIDVREHNETSAIDLSAAGACTIILDEGTTNTLKAGHDRPGIYVPDGKQVIFDGTGELAVTGGASWPGIGRKYNSGNILIQGGNITATGGSNAAAIGGSWGHGGGTIAISGGSVTATGGPAGAGIGGGLGGAGGTTTISGGSVEAKGGNNGGAGIGGGASGAGGTITISGGSVTANGGRMGAGIGGGSSSAGGTITISGGSVMAGSSYYASGIGGGEDGAGGNIAISGGSVRATGNRGGADIGGFYGADAGTFSTGINGHAIIEGSNISDRSDESNWSCIIYRWNDGQVYGDPILQEGFAIPEGKNLTIHAGKTLTIPTGKTLNVPAGTTLNNHGTMINFGTIIEDGTINGNGVSIAPESVSTYMDADGAEQSANCISISNATVWSEGWYVADSTAAISSRIRVNGNVGLILEDGCTLDASQGIAVNEGGSLTVYCQSGRTGALIAYNPTEGGAAIGANRGKTAGNVTINGGNITATVNNQGGACIGMGGLNGGPGSVTIHDGCVNLTCDAGSEGAFGGSGQRQINGGVVVYGGTAEDKMNGTLMNNCIVFRGNTGQVYGNVTPKYNLEIPTGKTLNVPTGATLTVPAGTTLTNSGTLTIDGALTNNGTITNSGTLTIALGGTLVGGTTEEGAATGAINGTGTFNTENLAEDMISLPDDLAYYNGEDDQSETIKNQLTFSTTPVVICGQAFQFDSTRWTPSVTKTDDLHYTVTYTHTASGATVTKPVTLAQSGTEFVDGGAVKTYKGEVETGEFTYGDTITVKAKPTPTGNAPIATFSLTPPTTNQMALYYNNQQISDTVNAEPDGQYTMTVSVQALVEANAPYNQEVPLTVKYGGTGQMAAAEETVTVTLHKAPLTITGATLAEKTYDGNATATVTAVELQGVVEGATLTMGEGEDYTATATFDSANVNEANTVTVTVTLHNQNYSLKANTFEVQNATIAPKELTADDVTVTVNPATYEYTGSAITPEASAVTVTYTDGTGKAVTIPSSEYSFICTGNTNHGTATLTLHDEENGNYIVNGRGTFEIAQSSLAAEDVTVTLSETEYTYDGQPKTPTVTVKKGNATVNADEYTISYSNSNGGDGNRTNAGTVTVTVTAKTDGNYSGSNSDTFTIKHKQEATPSATIDYQNEALTGLTAGNYSITPTGGTAATVTVETGRTTAIQPEWFGKTLTIVKTAQNNNYANSEVQTLPIPARPATPSGALTLTKTATSVTVSNAIDGNEYSIDGTNWNETGNFTGLAAGTAYNIQVQVKATGSSFRSEAMSQTVTTVNSDGSTILKPGESTTIEGTTVTNNGDTITVTEDGKTTTITPAPDDGAAVSGNGTVTAPDGSTVQTGDDGPVITVGPGNGGTVCGDGSVTVEDGGKVTVEGDPNTTITLPGDGTVKPNPDGAVDIPEGSTVQTGNGPAITLPNGGTVDQNGNVTADKVQIGDTTITGEGITAAPDGTVTIPGSGTVQIGDSETIQIPASGGSIAPGGQVTYKVTVIFDSQGGSQVESQTITVGGKAEKPADPTRDGYVFGGWYTDSDCKTAWSFENAVSGDMTLYAKWMPRPVSADRPSVTVQGEGGKAEAGKNGTVTIIPDKGYEIVKITVNGKEVIIPADGKLTGLKPTDKVVVTFGAISVSRWFTDVPAGAWYEDAVRFVSGNGLMGGYGNGQFGVHDNLSRAQLAQILFNKEGRPVVNDPLQYDDVATGAWYTEAVRWATSQGIVTGYGNGNFGPNDPITREQLAVMLWRYSGSPAAANQELYFNDTDEISDFAWEAMRWAVENGIINGYSSGRLDPQGQATRAQVAQMLKNFLENGN